MKVSLKAVFVSLCLSGMSFAHTFKIAGLYPESMAGHFNCTCGLEAQCITKAAVKEANDAGLPVRLDLYDNGRDPLTTAQMAKKIAGKQYDVAIGTLVSAEALAASKIFEKARLPFVVPTASHPEVTHDKTYVIRTAFNDYRQADLLAKLTVQELNKKRVAIVENASNPYSDFLGTEYAAQLRKRNVTQIWDHPIVDGYSDFKPIVDQIVKNRAEIVFVPISQALLASLYAELAKRQVSITLLGSDIVEGEVQFLNLLGKTSPKISFIFVKHWNGRLEGPQAANYTRLRDKYCKQYAPTMTGAAAYDAITLLLETLKKYHGTTKDELVPRMKSMKYSGMTGTISYEGGGDPIKPLQLFTIQSSRASFWRTYQ